MKSLKIVSKEYLLNKILADMKKDNDLIKHNEDHENYAMESYENLSADTDNLLTLHETNKTKWIELNKIKFIPASECKKQYQRKPAITFRI